MTFVDYTALEENLAALNSCTVFVQGFPIYLGPIVPNVNLQALRQQLERDGFSVKIETVRLVNMTTEYNPVNVSISAPYKLGHVARQSLRSKVRQILSFNLMADNDYLR